MADDKSLVGGAFLITESTPEQVFCPEDLSEEHRMIRDAARDFVSKRVAPQIEALELLDPERMMALFKEAGELGLLSTDVPEAYGGMGLDKVSSTVVAEAMSGSGSFSVVYAAHTGIGTLPIVYYGTEEQKAKYLPKLASGEWCAAYCLTEADAGSDALNARTTARLSEDGRSYIINGEKIFISNAGWASSFIVYAKVDGEHFTGFIVEKDYPGVSTGKEEKKMGVKGSSTRPVIFEDAVVPVENVLHTIGKGHQIAFNVLNIGRWKLGAVSSGGCKACVQEAVAYANKRIQFGQPISSFGMIQTKLADMTIRAYVNESVMYRLAGIFDARMKGLDKTDGVAHAKAIEEYAAECSISKVYGSESADFCVDQLVQIHGGYGFIAEYTAERLYRDARINRIWEGTNEINRMLVPGTLMRRAMQGRLDLLNAAQAVAGELMSYSPLSVQLPDTPLAMQQHMLSMSKKLTLMIAGVAVQKFGFELSKEQEVLAALADMCIEVFAMESALLRTLKLIEKRGEEKCAGQLDAMRCYVDDCIPKMERWAKTVATYCERGDMLRTQLAGIKKFMRYQPIDSIAAKRRLAKLVCERENYPF
ncbi:MAG: acyl-CoA dehydrogenase family protein [Myxococcota bacterium]|jgi:alkylation response protein AidB-like acyl-CoA dehydrogenase|nr:acyl-CoA dehydrogenase family protein [Myxococcota bacterium]